MNRDLNSPKALAAIEKARKLLGRAYDKATVRVEREAALKSANAALKPWGLSVEDLKEQSTPDYLIGARASSVGYNSSRGVSLAKGLAARGWASQDPREHGYKKPPGGEHETIEDT